MLLPHEVDAMIYDILQHLTDHIGTALLAFKGQIPGLLTASSTLPATSTLKPLWGRNPEMNFKIASSSSTTRMVFEAVSDSAVCCSMLAYPEVPGRE
jgi:hypothetical protein